MDENTTTVVENDAPTNETPNVAVACLTAFAVSAASTAGAFAGVVVVGFAAEKVSNWRERRADNKVTLTPEYLPNQD